MIFGHIRENLAAAFFPRLSEWFAAFVLISIGTMLSVNTTLMETAIKGGYGQGYYLLLAVAPQGAWATAITVFGFGRLLILLVNGAWRRSPMGRAIAAFLSCFFWTQIVLSFAPTFGFAFVMACGWLGADMVNVMRAARDARTVSDALGRGKRSGMGLE